MQNKKSVIALTLIGVIGIIGLTFAYFLSSTDVDNEFNTADYGTTITEEFVSPDNWVPGATEEKRVYVTNIGEVPVAVRISYTESWTSLNGDSLDLTFRKGNKDIAAANFEFGDDFVYNWVKSTENGVDYYYYNAILDSGEETTDFIKSITFNPNVPSTANCTETNVYDEDTDTNTAIELYDNNLWHVGLKAQLGKDVKAEALYLRAKTDAEDVKKNGFTIGLNYKGANPAKKGTWGIGAKYYNQGDATYYSHGFDATRTMDLDGGFKGFRVAANYTFDKGIVGNIHYYDFKAKEGNEKSKTLFTSVVFTF